LFFLEDHHIHRNLFSGFSIIHWEDLQNQTIIFANYSTTQSFGASIITTRQGTWLSADWMEPVSDEQYQG
jgi:hypothetical protein